MLAALGLDEQPRPVCRSPAGTSAGHSTQNIHERSASHLRRVERAPARSRGLAILEPLDHAPNEPTLHHAYHDPGMEPPPMLGPPSCMAPSTLVPKLPSIGARPPVAMPLAALMTPPTASPMRCCCD